MAFLPLIAVILYVIACVSVTPVRGRSYRRKSKGFFGGLLAGQARTERRNSSHRGVMCGPGGVGARGGKRRR